MTTPSRSKKPETAWRVGPTDPSIIGVRVHNQDRPVSAFEADKWDLTPLGGPPNQRTSVIVWTGFPPEFRDAFRRAAWLLINTATPTVMLDKPGSAAVEYYSAATIRRFVCANWLKFAIWLQKNGFRNLSQVTRSDLERYALYVQGLDCGRRSKHSYLRGVTHLWAHAPNLPAEDALLMPPWDDEPFSDFLPVGNGRSQNTTPIIHPSTMAPLLFWALKFLDFAPDVVAARQRWQTLIAEQNEARGRKGEAAADLLVASWVESGCLALPASHRRPDEIAFAYLEAVNGLTPAQIKGAIKRSGSKFRPDPTLPAAIDSPIKATIDGVPWCDHIDYRDLIPLRNAVSAAGLVVVAYLSGMRPAEVLSLRRGCCVRERVSATAIHYKLIGRKYKRVVKEGKSDPDGAERSWTTIAPVAQAIQQLEKLFPESAFLFPSARDSTGPMTTSKAADSIATLIEMANRICDRLRLPDAYKIPNDPAGPIALGRFRRTLAWHIRRLPHGPVALAIQYGHLSVSQGVGYSGLAVAGFAAMMDAEDAAVIAENIEQARRDLVDGQSVSGPAAKRLVHLVNQGVAFNGNFLRDSDVLRIKNDTRLRIYENPQSYALCMFDPTRALCKSARMKEALREPKLIDCQPNCPNVARLDRHIAELQTEAIRLAVEADSPLTPVPMAERLRQHAAHCRSIIENHRATALGSGASEAKREATA